jgi:hypothetical protein
VDLDNHEGGDITGLSGVVNGYIYAFKFSQIYRLARQGVRTKAYNAVAITKKRGALAGSVVEAFDNAGNPIVLFLDPDIGPCLLGARGAEPCGADLIKTWETINLDASKAVSRGIYFPEKQQVHWWVATDDSDVPDLRLVLHVREMRWTDNGYRRGWAVWTGQASGALAACMFAANVEDDAARSLALVPFVAVEGNGLIWQTEVGDDDNGTDYHARLLSKPFVHGNILHKFACKNGALIAKAASNAVVDVTVIPDFGVDSTAEREVAAVDLSPAASEPRVIRALDDLSLSAVTVLQVEIEDPETPGTRWEIDMVGLKESRGQTS